MKETLYQHFNASEHAFVEKLLDLVARLETQYCHQLTDFLDPRQQDIAQSVLTRAGVTYYSSRELYPLEQARLILAPDYYQLEPEDFEMVLVAITYQGKFSQLSHSQILGSLLNGLGLKRQVIGDVLVTDGYAQVVLDKQMASYIIANTDKMARTGVTLKVIGFEQLLTEQPLIEEQLVLTSSLRLDKLVALLTRQNRSQAQDLIVAGKVKINHREVLKPIVELVLGDLISIRGYGRFRLREHLGMSKSNKHKLMIEKTINR